MEEAKIPVLSVLKKGTILKNIFLNTPPPGTRNPLSPSADEDLMLVGRHPDCHIIVDHPSISRLHLAILPKSTMQKLLVTDRSSVHGTWVSGKRIEPNTPVELCEGDTFRLGASTRIFHLHWMPLSHAFEMEMPMSPLIEEASDPMDSDEVPQHENSNEVQFRDIIPSAPLQLEILKDPFPGDVIAGDFEKVGQILTGKDMFTHISCFSSIAPLLDSASFSSPMEDVSGSSDSVLANACQPSRGLDQKTKPSSLLSRRNMFIRLLQIKRTREDNRSEITSAKVCSEIKEQLVGDFAEENEGVMNSIALLTEVKVEEEEKPFISDKKNRTPVNSMSSKLLKSSRRIDRSFSLCNNDDLEIEEQKITRSGEEKIPSCLLSECDPVEEEEDMYVSDKANVSPVNSNGSKELKRIQEIERLPLSSFGLFNTYDLEIEQQKHGVIEVGKVEAEENCGSNIEKLTPVKCIEPKSLKNDREFERQLLGSFNLCKLGKEHYDLGKENQIVMNRSKSSYLKVGNLSMKEKEVSMFCSVNDTGPLLSPAIKSQRTLFKAQRSPLNEKKKLNVEEICFHSNKEKTSEIPNSLKRKNAASRDLLKDKFFSDQGNNPEAPSSLKTKKSFTRDFLKAESKENSALASNKENFTPQNSICVESNKVLSENHGKSEAEALNDEIFENKSFPSEDRFLSDKKKTNEAPNSLTPKKTFARYLMKDMHLSDKENTPEAPNNLKTKKSTAKDLLMSESKENATFFSDKENLTPQNSKRMQSKKVLSEIHGKTDGETMNRRKERIPFQPLLECSPLRSSTLASYVHNDQDDNCCNKDSKNVQRPEENFFDSHIKEELPHMPEREKKKWYFVVDVGCLLTEESKKSLQLLEGIRGTQLIIPRIVIRELDHLKRCQGILSRGTKAYSILQWIEECMMKSSWWIHVQSTSETFPAAPTPPVTPRSLCDGSTGFSTTSFNLTGFSTHGCLMEIVSPTTEDHILDCALLFKRIKSDGQLVLLTSSTTLRIKAMAEGLLCETAKEFRESLVNPFSKRFLWMESSPRGSTWSCLEVVLPENCHKQFAAAVRTPKGEGTVKGLKLILLHSSNFGTTYLT
ncbi:hypothetical protein KSP40_PGU011272 [Platanthera guangdongensis]|uniref:FHA domain-containing protein n=1 Tax=Platanthera guangdongensis TaxID=2320717 RepID=A0ABR2M375_9ASPA